jgi:peptidoglycan/xylan/chitin deacetylase (PgdA/CDA1 family)
MSRAATGLRATHSKPIAKRAMILRSLYANQSDRLLLHASAVVLGLVLMLSAGAANASEGASIWHEFGRKPATQVAIKAASRSSSSPSKPTIANKPEPAKPSSKPAQARIEPKLEPKPQPKVVVASATPPAKPMPPPVTEAKPMPPAAPKAAAAPAVLSPLLAPDGVAPAAPLKPATKLAALPPAKSPAPPPKVSPPTPPDSVTTRPPQFVVLAFDGSQSDEMWKATMGLADTLKKDGKPAKFTYFISGVYFLSEKTRRHYDAPGRGPGSSFIGFGSSRGDDIPQRIANVNAAHAAGHEIASHANGHFDGKSWSEDMWRSEFRQFDDLLFSAAKNNALADDPTTGKPPALTMAKRSIVGFRAPMLGHSQGLWPTMVAHGFRYDTSRSNKPDYWPKKLPGAGWNFALGEIRVPGTSMRTLSMDYNFYVVQSGAKPNPSQAARYEEQMLDAYLQYFNGNYLGNRAPVHIGHHFAQWNNGAYWRAFQRFARAVCGKPEVKCVTYRELADYLDTVPDTNLASFQKGSFPRFAGAEPVKTTSGPPLDITFALADTGRDGALSLSASGADWLPAAYRISFEIGGQPVADNVVPSLSLVRAAYPVGGAGTFGWRIFKAGGSSDELEVARLTFDATALGTAREAIAGEPREAAALEGEPAHAHQEDCDHPLAH